MRVLENFIDGETKKPSSGAYLDVISPLDDSVCGKVALSGPEDVNEAVEKAKNAFLTWSKLTVKSRAKILHKFYELINDNAEELAKVINIENGKTIKEALAEIAKGNESVEWACGLPTVIKNSTSIQQVSSAVQCKEELRPLGVVVSIVPFNFPAMVPLWTLPVAIASGNCLIVKPSEKCPMTLYKIVCELANKAGIPKGVLQLVNGDKVAVEALMKHEHVSAVTFVGSSFVANLVYKTVTQQGKRCLSLGGAKNHLVALSDCNVEMTSNDILSSFAGCAGQRCMAASVLILVGENKALIEELKKKALQLKPGKDKGCMGPVIDQTSKKKILSYLSEVDKSKTASFVLDGRTSEWVDRKGSYVGPTIILHQDKSDKALHDEIFGPVLSVYVAKNSDEAIEMENASPYGNAACIYTQDGGKAEWFCQRFRAGMIGVNIGIPVPREPFSFGGLYGTQSMYGHGDITGESALSFFTNRVKVTTKWSKFETGDKEDISQFK